MRTFDEHACMHMYIHACMHVCIHMFVDIHAHAQVQRRWDLIDRNGDGKISKQEFFEAVDNILTGIGPIGAPAVGPFAPRGHSSMNGREHIAKTSNRMVAAVGMDPELKALLGKWKLSDDRTVDCLVSHGVYSCGLLNELDEEVIEAMQLPFVQAKLLRKLLRHMANCSDGVVGVFDVAAHNLPAAVQASLHMPGQNRVVEDHRRGAHVSIRDALDNPSTPALAHDSADFFQKRSAVYTQHGSYESFRGRSSVGM